MSNRCIFVAVLQVEPQSDRIRHDALNKCRQMASIASINRIIEPQIDISMNMNGWNIF